MISLKAFLPLISRIFSTTPAALYERQRALVRLGVLEPIDGRGPGTGVPLTAENVAALIVALAVTDNLSDTDARVAKLCQARPLFKSACPFTGATTFRGALGAVLSSVQTAVRLDSVHVDRAPLSAMILYRPRRKSMHSPFQSSQKTSFVWPAITTNVMISGGSIKMTTGLLEHALSGASGIPDDKEAS
jgi:hypothetical protein